MSFNSSREHGRADTEHTASRTQALPCSSHRARAQKVTYFSPSVIRRLLWGREIDCWHLLLAEDTPTLRTTVNRNHVCHYCTHRLAVRWLWPLDLHVNSSLSHSTALGTLTHHRIVHYFEHAGFWALYFVNQNLPFLFPLFFRALLRLGN